MRISYNWLKEYLNVMDSAERIAEMLTGLGLEVSSVERVETIRGGLRGVVAGKVLTCIKHPNAVRLKLTTVDIGTGTPLQIVCGAPNVAAGQKVWVATPGSVLFPSRSEKPLEISRAKVRGEISEGMICAEDELGLGEDHSGILVLPDDVAVGIAASEYYHVTTDDIFDIELTPNRSDAICHIGVARDLAAWLAVHGEPAEVRLPQIAPLQSMGDYRIEVEVENTEACLRYCGLTLTGIRIQESPDWLRNRLRAIGVKPINQIVDVTNFVLHEMGQPLHAFDADQITGRRVIVRTLPEGTPFIALDGQEYALSAHDLMICDGNGAGMCIAGVYGGLGSGITADTTNVFLESAHFNPKWIRRTSQRHDLRTDAARTFEKSTDPNICRDALLRAASLILEISGGQSGSEILDLYPDPVLPAQVKVRWEMIHRLTGTQIPADMVLKILAALNMEVISRDATGLTVAVPTNKADVMREADVIEEILRIYGYDEVMIRPRIEVPLIPPSLNDMHALRDRLGNFLSAQGFLETMAMSLVESRKFEGGPLQIHPDERILIKNTSNIHLDMMRHSLLASALESVSFNQNRMQTDLMLYEFGNTYRRVEGQIAETEHLALSVTGDLLSKGWRRDAYAADFFSLKKYVHLTLAFLGLRDWEVRMVRDPQWDFALSYAIDSREICTFGRVSRSLAARYDLRHEMYYAEFPMHTLLELTQSIKVTVREISKYPAVLRDLAVVLPVNVAYRQIEEIVFRAAGDLLTGYGLFDVYENAEALGEGNRSLALSLIFQDPTHTLKDSEVKQAVDRIVHALAREAGASLR